MSKYLDEKRKADDPEGRRSPDRCPFDAEDLEALVASFTTKDEIPLVLDVERTMMDRFCQHCYGKTYSEAYERLFARVMHADRQMLIYLAKEGHTGALGIVAKDFMRLGNEAATKSLRVQIVNDLGEGDDEEAEGK